MRLILLTILSLWSSLRPISSECGYNACHKTDPKKLNVHLVAHSHDDVGWISTPDGYYDDSVRQIITNVVKSLEANPQRRFIQVEIYYFHRWWKEQNQQMRDAVKKLVENGQFIFVNGGWTVNDEGCAHYNNIIDQLTLGLRFLNDTFGHCGHPKTSWQIDPFGASKEVASIYAMMNYDGHVVNRGEDPKGEFVLKASNDANTRIFTTVLHNHYSAPDGYNFEDNKNDINEQNSGNKADHFVDVVKGWNKDYGNTNHILVPMGDDFQYKNAENWFLNMDKLIADVNNRHQDVNVFYSSPDCYVKALNSLNRTVSERDIDYLTLWVGYYTSRPSLKYQDRLTNNIVQASKQLDVLSRLDPTRSSIHLNEAKNQLAVLTHHDAITGTSPQGSADDYTSRLQSGYSAAKAVIQKAYSYIKYKQKTDSTEVFCDFLNVTECSITETNDKIAVTIYNPIARPVFQYIRVPVSANNYQVFDASGQKVNQISVTEVSDAVKHLSERHSNANYELVFRAGLPALGFTTYFIEKHNSLSTERTRKKRAVTELKGKSFTVEIDENSGSLKSVTVNGQKHRLEQTFKFYKSAHQKQGEDDSNPYLFCPDGTAQDMGPHKLIATRSSGGVHEVDQQFSDYVKQTIRTYEDQDYIELDWTVGPIPKDSDGQEVVSHFETDFKTDNIFYTDSNGRQTMKRRFDANRKGCGNNVIAGNWYPIYSRIAIKDENNGFQLTILTDRSEGGASLANGQLELMVHRRVLHSWGFTLDEPGVDGKGLVVRGKHYIFVQPINKSPKLVRDMSESLFMGPILTFDKYTTIQDYSSQRVTTFTGLNRPLPENVNLLTLENWKPNQVLLRLEHIYESSDNNQLSKPFEVDINGLFKTFKVLDSVETTLAANELISESKRLQWNSHSLSDVVSNRTKRAVDFKVKLSPQQIRTFILTVEDNIHKEEKCTYSWVKTNPSNIPKNAYIGGHDVNNEPLYVCRHKVDNNLIVGKADKIIGCVVTYGGNEVYFRNEEFEVLIANNVEWVARHGTDPIPEHALVGGSQPNREIYIGRCEVKGTVQVGKIDYDFYYGFGFKEFKDCVNHEVMVCVQ